MRRVPSSFSAQAARCRRSDAHCTSERPFSASMPLTPVNSDLSEGQILAFLDRYRDCKLVLSPIGAQGFVLGRGNQQLSPAVVHRVGAESIIVASTPAKLAQTLALRFDSGMPGSMQK
jgi:predicted polyphosphate/ATP-dependent NAD kinase